MFPNKVQYNCEVWDGGEGKRKVQAIRLLFLTSQPQDWIQVKDVGGGGRDVKCFRNKMSFQFTELGWGEKCWKVVSIACFYTFILINQSHERPSCFIAKQNISELFSFNLLPCMFHL